MADEPGFFNRWSRLKSQSRQEPSAPVRHDTSLAPSAVPAQPPLQPPSTAGDDALRSDVSAVAPPPASSKSRSQEPQDQASASWPTMDDVRQLTPDADFSRFVAPGTSSDVRNAAMKKLFADPFFNQMDGLDIYIDDYSKSDPLPLSLARKLASAQFMKLFDEPAEKPTSDPPPTLPEPNPETSPAVDPIHSSTPNPTERSSPDSNLA